MAMDAEEKARIAKHVISKCSPYTHPYHVAAMIEQEIQRVEQERKDRQLLLLLEK